MIAPSLEPVLPGIRTVTVVRRPAAAVREGLVAVPHPRTNEAASVSRASWCPRIPKGDSGLTDESGSDGSFARQRRRGRAGPSAASPDQMLGRGTITGREGGEAGRKVGRSRIGCRRWLSCTSEPRGSG